MVLSFRCWNVIIINQTSKEIHDPKYTLLGSSEFSLSWKFHKNEEAYIDIIITYMSNIHTSLVQVSFLKRALLVYSFTLIHIVFKVQKRTCQKKFIIPSFHGYQENNNHSNIANSLSNL